MKNLLKLEEFAVFLLSLYIFSRLEFPWYYFPALLFLPDLSMLGYLSGSKVGALFYNLFHHKGIAVIVGLWGFAYGAPLLALAGVILLAHSSFDRILGYGLKYSTSFHDTHLGKIGPGAGSSS
ncbi:DUF4260 domain-containing protein [Dyadobacter tibetensis]|uniref:DUF4260 domain-containing protein n=1 Tax=Dyadobacter tibetensis TaxID=1211851 RepID=UPI0004707603|nr:DUF4260 domain-containing protein [Dyadobacter tibetensis]